MAEAIVNVSSMDSIIALFGRFDENLNILQRQYGVVILSRGNDIRISGDEPNVMKAKAAVEALAAMADKGENINEQSLRYIFSMVEENSVNEAVKLTDGGICVTSSGKVVKAKTLGQKKYVDAISKNTIVMGIGPAGTGKTYLAVAMAVKAFKNHEINRIILTRPAVEAGEKLGFLPGDLQNKVDPYLRPLYDALFDMMGAETFAKYIEKGSIEVAPLAYMRGRTLDDAFIILDEAQNTTREQIKMFLTRLGFNSKMVITGDITQIDLPDAGKSVSAKRTLSATSWYRILSRHTKRQTKKGRSDLMPKLKVYIKNNQKNVKIPVGLRLLVRKSCAAVLSYEHFGNDAEVSVSFVNNNEIRRLNKQFRGKDKSTDVLSFPLGEDGVYDINQETGALLLGDVVISMETAVKQAKTYGHSLEREVGFLTVHSMLHLLGYAHETSPLDAANMREKEEAILGELGISRDVTFTPDAE